MKSARYSENMSIELIKNTFILPVDVVLIHIAASLRANMHRSFASNLPMKSPRVCLDSQNVYVLE